MSLYSLRKNFKVQLKTPDKIITAKAVFKTKETNWLNTDEPVIIPISIHSAFHNENQGEIKISTLVSVIKNHVKGKVTMAEKAHTQVLSLKYQGNYQKAWEECVKSSQLLVDRYQAYFDGCLVLSWSYIEMDRNYEECKKNIVSLSETDFLFREYLIRDAEDTYTENRIKEFPNRKLYIEKAVKDILEQCIAQLVMAKKGYRFLFYPGKSFTSQKYAATFFAQEGRLSWISVFLSIEKQVIHTLKNNESPTSDFVCAQ